MPRTRVEPTVPLRLVFARNIRTARIHANISQERLAADAGLDRAFVGTLERGQRNISIDNIALIAKALGIAAHELMDPTLAERHGMDATLTRSPRTFRAYPVARKSGPAR